MSRPTMFVGSSSESRDLVEALSLNLDGRVDVDNWATRAWELSQDTLYGIERALDDADFAAFILAPDDTATIKGEEVRITRDNVLFELGMSFGSVGRKRTFILAPGDGELALRATTDLLGISTIQYRQGRDARATMANPANRIWEAVQEAGPRSRPTGARNGYARGDTGKLDVIADAAVHVFESRNEYAGQLRRAVLKGEKVPAKFQFAQPDGGRHWLDLCHSPSYRYFIRAKKHLQDSRWDLAESIREAAGTAAIDLVSLGSGDGSKDDLILRSLADKLSDPEYLYYYPIDISDTLLVEAVRHVREHGLNRKRYRCKAVLGDFTRLESLSVVTGHRPNVNVFSVLGNTLGTFDESDIIASLAGAMAPGDLVLIEANIGEPENSVEMLDDDVAHQWDLSTLAALGIPRNSYTLDKQLRGDESMVPDTRTLVSSAVPDSDPPARYLLSGLHHYNLTNLKGCLSTELDVDLMAEFLTDGVALLLGRRRQR